MFNYRWTDTMRIEQMYEKGLGSSFSFIKKHFRRKLNYTQPVDGYRQGTEKFLVCREMALSKVAGGKRFGAWWFPAPFLELRMELSIPLIPPVPAPPCKTRLTMFHLTGRLPKSQFVTKFERGPPCATSCFLVLWREQEYQPSSLYPAEFLLLPGWFRQY